MIENLQENQVLTVTQANQLAKELLEAIPIWVEGEAFDVRQKDQRYRYNYFYLKDPETEYQLPCIAEPYYVNALPFSFEEGSKYRMYGTLTLWEKGGKYQFSVRKIVPVGEGNLLKDMEELKNKLQSLGLFDDGTKKRLPNYPEKIGVITSLASGSAAWEDFKRHSIDIFPFIEIIVRDSYVQGDKAVADLVSAIEELDKLGLDLIVLTRGGGSAEDLMAFNSEAIAFAIFNATTPVVSAIGHEKDITIADLVADARASTPTNAAHLITQHYHTFFERVDYMATELQKSVMQKNTLYFQELDMLYEKLAHIRENIALLPKSLDSLQDQIAILTKMQIDRKVERLAALKTQLSLLSPENTLARGYSIVSDSLGALVRDVDGVAKDQTVSVRLARGKFDSKVIKKYKT